MKRLLVFASLLFVVPAQADVTIEWVTVGDPGNAADDTGYGAVAYIYQICKYEITNAQYAEFLNAVAATDTYWLYVTDMGNPSSPYFGGITRSGSPGSYTYSAIVGREHMPVRYVSFYNSLRFANWLHNGQPTGAQDWTTTEFGAYNMSLGSAVVRRGAAKVFLPSEDEWYKAAYYDGSGPCAGRYCDYPAGSDTQTTCAAPGATTNTANCDDAVGDRTNVGSYTGSASPNGTFDQGGNLWEWNETLITASLRGVRGGSFIGYATYLAASRPDAYYPRPDRVGFRVARHISAPTVPSMRPMGVALLGSLVFGIGLVGLVIAARRRLK